MTTIQETVDQGLATAGLSGYANHARPVVTALVAREEGIVGRLIQFAQNSALDVAAVRTALSEAGLQVPVEAPAETAAAQTVGQTVDAGIAAALARIEQTMNGLVTFA